MKNPKPETNQEWMLASIRIIRENLIEVICRAEAAGQHRCADRLCLAVDELRLAIIFWNPSLDEPKKPIKTRKKPKPLTRKPR